MVLDDIFERFARQSPVPVMVRASPEHAPSAQAIDALFEQTARRQSTRTLLLSSVVDLMGAVVAKIQPAVNAAYRAKAEALGVSLRAVYGRRSGIDWPKPRTKGIGSGPIAAWDQAVHGGRRPGQPGGVRPDRGAGPRPGVMIPRWRSRARAMAEAHWSRRPRPAGRRGDPAGGGSEGRARLRRASLLREERDPAERLIDRIEQHRRATTRSEEAARDFLGSVHVAAIAVLLPWPSRRILPRCCPHGLINIRARAPRRSTNRR